MLIVICFPSNCSLRVVALAMCSSNRSTLSTGNVAKVVQGALQRSSSDVFRVFCWRVQTIHRGGVY